MDWQLAGRRIINDLFELAKSNRTGFLVGTNPRGPDRALSWDHQVPITFNSKFDRRWQSAIASKG